MNWVGRSRTTSAIRASAEMSSPSELMSVSQRAIGAAAVEVLANARSSVRLQGRSRFRTGGVTFRLACPGRVVGVEVGLERHVHFSQATSSPFGRPYSRRTNQVLAPGAGL